MRGRRWWGWVERMALIDPRCVARKYTSSRTSHVQSGRTVPSCTILRAGEDPSTPSQKTCRARVPRDATLGPKWRHCLPKGLMANHQHANGHAFLAYFTACRGTNELFNLILCDPIHRAPTATHPRHGSGQSHLETLYLFNQLLGLRLRKPSPSSGWFVRLSRLSDA